MKLTSAFDELAFENWLPQHSYSVIRMDGKSFSKLTRPLKKNGPFHNGFGDWMEATTMDVLRLVDGAVAAYTGSDEITVVIKNSGERSEKWFGGRVCKIASLAAARAAVSFSRESGLDALFDARVFDVGTDPQNAADAMWERRESVRVNSVQMLGHYYFGHNYMMNRPVRMVREDLQVNNTSWDDIPNRFKYGVFFYKDTALRETTFVRNDTGAEQTVMAERSIWITTPAVKPFELTNL